MTPDRTLYLHIGCGKTGSSALQVWLNHQAEALKKLGVNYPTFGADKLDTYAITSGNGMRLVEAVAEGRLEGFVQQLAKSQCDKLLLSSERFQAFTEANLQDLKAAAARAGFRIAIIVYLRDVYDFVYSAHQQQIKRHLNAQAFRPFGLGQRRIQQFQVIETYSRHFDDIRAFHYDSERERGLDLSFCDALGIDPGGVERMPDAKVNRSLDSLESELLRIANATYAACNPTARPAFSARASDAMIYADPERETEILLDQKVLQHLEELCRPAIDRINGTLLQKTPMTVFDPARKRVVRQVPEPPATFAVLLENVIRFLCQEGFDKQAAAASRGKAADESDTRRIQAGESLSLDDPRIVKALRDEAVRVEAQDPHRALALMAAAAELRPTGEAIRRKLEEYRARVRNADEQTDGSVP